MSFHELVRIEAAGKLQDAYMHAFIEKDLNRFFGRVSARRIGIEIDRDGLGMALDGPYLVRRQCSSATRDHLLHAGRVDPDHVHVPFDEHGAIVRANRLLGAMQVIKDVFFL